MSDSDLIAYWIRLFNDQSDEAIALKLFPEMEHKRKLAVAKAIGRLRRGETTQPRGEVRERILEAAREIREFRDALDDPNRKVEVAGMWVEAWKRAQNRVAVSVDSSDNIRPHLPAFMVRVLERMDQGKYSVVIDLLADRLVPPDVDHIPAQHLPDILNYLGVALQYEGLHTDAVRRFEEAEQRLGELLAAENGDNSGQLYNLRSIVQSNLAGCFVRLGNWSRADLHARASRSYSENNPASYFNGLCAAALARDSARVGMWIGLCQDVVSRGSIREPLLSELGARLHDDEDLSWARDLELWPPFLAAVDQARSRPRTTS